jgi:hypothetical protein
MFTLESMPDTASEKIPDKIKQKEAMLTHVIPGTEKARVASCDTKMMKPRPI